jgi:hypothetical protein
LQKCKGATGKLSHRYSTFTKDKSYSSALGGTTPSAEQRRAADQRAADQRAAGLFLM